MNRTTIAYGSVDKKLLRLNMVVALIYISWWFIPGNAGQPVLYGLLLIGEIYHVIMAFLFWHTVWPSKKIEAPLEKIEVPVDIFITVTGEPVEVVRRTAVHAKNIEYPNFKLHLLNDGFAAKKDNWQEIEALASELDINCITRQTNTGAKAGNINNAMAQTSGEVIVIFDADMAPHSDFLQKVMSYFSDSKTGFVQSPQYYNNHHVNAVAGSSWEQQEIFFGPIMRGKEKSNATFICGTNVAIRRQALLEVGGMCEDNIAEDFLTSLFIHQKGWNSYYVPEVLAEGYAPEDMLAYYKQQLRWARGSLEVVFTHNPLFKKGLSIKQKAEYLSSGLHYCNGIIIAIDASMPIVSLMFNIQPVAATTTSFAFFFIPFLFLNLFTLYRATGANVTFRAQAFSMSLWTVQLTALKSLLTKQKMKFAVTPKQAQQGNFISVAYPHIVYTIVVIIAAAIGINREGLSPSVVTNITWGLFNVVMFTPFIYASINWGIIKSYIPGMRPQTPVVTEKV